MQNPNNQIRVLLVTFHFPPYEGSSGILRTLKFVRYLPEFAIEPVVLTANVRAYDRINGSLKNQIPESVQVRRAFALDTRKHLSFRGAYFDFMANPDRYLSWIPAAVLSGLALIRKQHISVLFSTSPVPSAHLIGYYLHRITRKPWIADFRDPMWDDYSNFGPSRLKTIQKVEAQVVSTASRVTVTTHGMYRLFLKRYPKLRPEKIQVITNGFDENDFQNLPAAPSRSSGPIVCLHTGLLQTIDRDPLPFFKAIAILKAKKMTPQDLVVVLYAPGNETEYQRTVAELGLNDFIQIHSAIPYQDALQKMVQADILLLFQGPSCNDQIPAKAYEYFRIGKPIFALTPEAGETAHLVHQMSAGTVVPPDHPVLIAEKLSEWIAYIQKGLALPAANLGQAMKFSRKSQTGAMAHLFRQIIPAPITIHG